MEGLRIYYTIGCGQKVRKGTDVLVQEVPSAPKDEDMVERSWEQMIRLASLAGSLMFGDLLSCTGADFLKEHKVGGVWTNSLLPYVSYFVLSPLICVGIIGFFRIAHVIHYSMLFIILYSTM